MLRFAVALAVLAVFTALPLQRPSTAEAHPLGNFSVSRYARIELGSEAVKLRYVIDMAEIPAFTEIKAVDTNGDGLVSESESLAYRLKKVPELLDHLRLAVGGEKVELTAGSTSLTFPEGQGGLDTLRLVIDASAPTDSGWLKGVSATFKDDNYADRVVGWKEIVIMPGEGVVLSNTTVSRTDQSAELTAYPEARLQSPLDVREASFRFEAAVPGVNTGTQPVASAAADPAKVPARTPDRFASLIARENLTPAFVAVSLLAAMFWGAAHALGPGHGKTIVAAYLVGSRSNAKHALILGLTVTATHTSTVFALGFLTLYASKFLPAEDLYVWLSVLSGGLVLVMGAFLFASRLRSILSRRAIASAFVQAHDHGDAHAHGDGHTHEHVESATPSRVFRSYSARRVPGATTAAEHTHDLALRSHEHDHVHATADAHTHSHGGSTHSHLPTQPGFKGLLLLGISGGLLPCPTALVVMLASIALERVAYGLVLVVAFSFGLAGVLTGIGVLLVYAGRYMNGSSRVGTLLAAPNMQRLMQAVPVLSAVVIFFVGLVLTGQALSTAL
jgi:ABC-type nickel/cobalt efflux system permease component RcnA